MPQDYFSLLISSPTLRALIVSSVIAILAIFRLAESGSALSFSIFLYVLPCLTHEFCRAKECRKKWRKHCIVGRKKKRLRRTTKLWIKRRKCGDERTRTMGEIPTLAVARGKKKKKASSVDAERTIPSAPAINVWTCSEAFNEVHLWYIHIRRVYTYINTGLISPTGPLQTAPFLCCVRLRLMCEIVRVIAWQVE